MIRLFILLVIGAQGGEAKQAKGRGQTVFLLVSGSTTRKKEGRPEQSGTPLGKTDDTLEV
jgi:hypothetical protein